MSSDDDQYENDYNGVNQDFEDDSEDDMEYQMPGKNGFSGKHIESDDDDDGEDEGDDDEEGGKVTAWGSQKKRFYKEGDDNMVTIKLREI